MNCDELVADYGAYALGIADEPERSEIARHLARNCPRCVHGIGEALELTAAMSGAVQAAEPPGRLRGRVIALVSPPREARWWTSAYLPWAAALGFAMALMFALIQERPHPSDSTKLEQALSILGDPATKDAAFAQPLVRGRVFVSPGRGIVFIASGLPAIDARHAFELWLIPPAGKPIPAGTFRGEADSAVYVRPGPSAQAGAVAVTVEPEGGSAQPTSTPFIVAKL